MWILFLNEKNVYFSWCFNNNTVVPGKRRGLDNGKICEMSFCDGHKDLLQDFSLLHLNKSESYFFCCVWASEIFASNARRGRARSFVQISNSLSVDEHPFTFAVSQILTDSKLFLCILCYKDTFMCSAVSQILTQNYFCGFYATKNTFMWSVVSVTGII